MERMLGAKLLRVQRDPHKERRRRTPVAMQNHAKLSLYDTRLAGGDAPEPRLLPGDPMTRTHRRLQISPCIEACAPAGTGAITEKQLATLVTRDRMIGTTVVNAP